MSVSSNLFYLERMKRKLVNHLQIIVTEPETDENEPEEGRKQLAQELLCAIDTGDWTAIE